MVQCKLTGAAPTFPGASTKLFMAASQAARSSLQACAPSTRAGRGGTTAVSFTGGTSCLASAADLVVRSALLLLDSLLILTSRGLPRPDPGNREDMAAT